MFILPHLDNFKITFERVLFNTLTTSCKELTHWKRPWCWQRLKAGGESDGRVEMVGWPHWLNGRELEKAPRVGDGQGSLACCSSWDRQEWDTTEWLTEWLLNCHLSFDLDDTVFYLGYICLYRGFSYHKIQWFAFRSLVFLQFILVYGVRQRV